LINEPFYDVNDILVNYMNKKDNNQNVLF